MTDFLKVTVDHPIQGVVENIAETVGKYGPNYDITLNLGTSTGVCTELKERVDKQLGMIGLNRDTAKGKLLKLWKKPMPDDPTKGYFNISFVGAERVAPPQAAPVNNLALAPVDPPIPTWLEPEVLDIKHKEQAKEDLTWAWNVAWGIMEPKLNGYGLVKAGDCDALAVQAVQAAAVALVIRLEHMRNSVLVRRKDA